ncbi:ABC transporter substrate-binding protein [Acinetobacter qingfengensis]|uniref:ABC transporter substrate-binding protein n=1 Tax=Acinetobacter qingfengensis TaxID=1262585 RepID=A0A1E7RDS7_9GAMM|nr:ABC transporter substrate-binding protein [Acinetobacter qingfengensis]
MQTSQSSTTLDTATSDSLAKEQSILDQNTPAIHTQPNPKAIQLIPDHFKLVEAGYLTVAVPSISAPPLLVLAADNKTYIGAEIDIARLIADSLGLQLKIVPTTWENWPLGLVSGKFDAVLSNIAVREERLQKYDLVSYRKDTLAFYVKQNSKIEAITGPDDISGLKIVVGSGTNQEKLLLAWIADNKKKGLVPAQPIYLEDSAAASLALQSGRVDALVIPNVAGRWQQLNGVKIKQVGRLNGIWTVAVALKKGTGFANAVQSSLNGVITSGEYKQVFSRWGLQDDALSTSSINPPVENQ